MEKIVIGLIIGFYYFTAFLALYLDKKVRRHI
jgi:hypothetical protein